MPDPLNLFLSIMFGIIGIAYCKYGRQNSFLFVFSGLMLMVFTFFVSETMPMLYTGLGLLIAPFILDKFFD